MCLPDSTRSPLKSNIFLHSETVKNYTQHKDVIPLELYQIIDKWKKGEKHFQFQTSGSTGKPKKIILHRQEIFLSAKKTINFFQLDHSHTALISLSIKYIAGFMMLIRAIESEMNIHYFIPTSDPFPFIHTDQLYFAPLVPLQMHTLLNKKYQLNNFYSIIIGGAAVNEELRNKIQFLKYPVYETYGMTETISHIALKRISGAKTSPYFQILSEVEIKVDENSCLMINSDVTNNTWISTTDIVELKDKNQFKVIGRLDEVINSGGIKIHPLEVESLIAINNHPFLKGVNYIITKKTDSVFGEKVILIVESLPRDINSSKLLNELFIGVEKYKRAKEIHFLHPFPRTQTGKIDRNKIRNTLA